jgi:hypothetical protein
LFMDEKQLAELEREAEERHRQAEEDIAALRRVKQMLTRHRPAQGRAESPSRTAQESSASTNSDVSSRAAVVRQIFISNAGNPLTIAKIQEELHHRGVKIEAVDERHAIHTTVAALKKTLGIRVHRKGSGNTPAWYVYAGHGQPNTEASPGVVDKIQGSFENMPRTLNGGGREE